jgi:hypothetical protein
VAREGFRELLIQIWLQQAPELLRLQGEPEGRHYAVVIVKVAVVVIVSVVMVVEGHLVVVAGTSTVIVLVWSLS